VPLDRFDILDENFRATAARALFGYHESWGLPKAEEIDVLLELMGPGGARLRQAA
jgi:hypothetical protein